MYFVMQKIDFKKVSHNIKIGDVCGDIKANITEDTLFYDEDEIIGFYIKNIGEHSERLAKLADVANKEFISARVPKMLSERSSGLNCIENSVAQYSTIIGSIPPKTRMRRPYPIRSSVHAVKSAEIFVKAMLQLCAEGEDLVKKLTPEIFDRQCKIITDMVPEKWRFGRMFTSSISNFNISAPFHRDTGNLEGCVNIIIAKKYRAEGGNTTVPDYGATVDSCDNSMLVYPAWRNVHGVTPIHVRFESGYRNSLVFYPLKAFSKLV